MKVFKFITKNKGKVAEFRAHTKASAIKIVQINARYPELQVDTLVEVAKYALQYCEAFYDPPFVVDFHKAAADLQSGEVLASDGTQSEQCNHQPIANLTRSGELSQISRMLGLVY